MGRLRARIRNLERDTERETTTLICPECGEEFVVAGDASVEFLVHEWVRETGGRGHRETPADAARAFGHEHDSGALLEKRSGLPFMSKAVSGIDLGEAHGFAG